MKNRTITAQEHEKIQSCAKKSGLTLSAYLRNLINGYVPREPPSADYLAFMKELRAIGNRMNQIAAKANATGFIQAEEYSANARELFDILLNIQAAVVLREKT